MATAAMKAPKRTAPQWASLAFTFSLLTIMAAPAKANDSSAELATGGLQFKKDSGIAMRAEDLFISLEKVRISYTFFNAAARDKTVLVAFPMPDIDGSQSNDNIVVPTGNADNLFDFHVTADGVAVPLHLEMKALAKSADQTSRLRSKKIPLLPVSAETNDALDHLTKDDKAEFIKLGLARSEPGAADEEHLVAAWTLQSAFTWTQTFPAGRDIHLDQTYRPSVGGSAQTFIGNDDWRKLPDARTYLRKYCLDKNFIDTIARARAAKRLAYPPFAEQRIAYILKTGANWAGPIGEFHLVIDKGDKANLVSFCASSVKKIGPTQFEIRKTQFTPEQDLSILILLPLASPD